jgi:MarR family transcriptional regulator, 2-MHQ and catechol-resistance regulon repressor
MTKYERDKETELALGAYDSLVRATEVVNALLRRHLDSFGLTMGQFRVLEALLHSGPMIQAALCERLLLDHGNASFIVGNLEKRGLIGRRAHGKDERSKTIDLALEGRRLIERVFPSYAGLVRAMMGELTQREEEALRRICGKLGHVDPVRAVLELTGA